jgi:hypothetical protein
VLDDLFGNGVQRPLSGFRLGIVATVTVGYRLGATPDERTHSGPITAFVKLFVTPVVPQATHGKVLVELL